MFYALFVINEHMFIFLYLAFFDVFPPVLSRFFDFYCVFAIFSAIFKGFQMSLFGDLWSDVAMTFF